MTSGWIGIAEFIHETAYAELPADIRRQARLCLFDLVGVAAAGTETPMSRILRDHAYRQAPGPVGSPRLLFDGRRVGAAHAAMANAGTIDSMDGHDGHRLVKGHAGVTVLPAALAFFDGSADMSTHDLLVTLAVGYEVALRAGITLHRTAHDYHSSGAWNSLGAAAVGARLLGLDAQASWHALGIAEYSAPRGPMMRAIAHPTMVKDSSAWGAQAGVSAALLAADGFTGGPAELTDSGGEWEDLGSRWRILEQYFKPYPVCRWAHPAVQAVLALTAQHVPPALVDHVEVLTFEAAAQLNTTLPNSTEEAQYSLPFAVAAALVHGGVSTEDVLDPRSSPAVLRVASRVRLTSSPEMTRAFPGTRQAQVRLILQDGRVLSSGTMTADGDPESPLSEAQLTTKFMSNTRRLAPQRSDALKKLLLGAEPESLHEVLNLMTAPA